MLIDCVVLETLEHSASALLRNLTIIHVQKIGHSLTHVYDNSVPTSLQDLLSTGM